MAEDNFTQAQALPEFGTGLRTHLARLTPEDAEESLSDTPEQIDEHIDLPEQTAEPEAWRVEPQPFVRLEPPTAFAPAEAPAEPTVVGSARGLLRDRADREGKLVWSVFEDALKATTASGDPDHGVRLQAASLLLAEAYGAPADGAQILTDAPAGADELADLRERRQR